jgi:hypothetical protein
MCRILEQKPVVAPPMSDEARYDEQVVTNDAWAIVFIIMIIVFAFKLSIVDDSVFKQPSTTIPTLVSAAATAVICAALAGGSWWFFRSRSYTYTHPQ